MNIIFGLGVAVFVIIWFIKILDLYNKQTRKFHGYNHAKRVLKRHKLQKGIIAFGSARLPDNCKEMLEIEEIGNDCAKYIVNNNKKISFITGGGPGVMKAWLKAGFHNNIQTAGFNMTLDNEQQLNKYADPYLSYTFTNFPARKQTMFDYAVAYVIFVGGLGTMDELFNTWMYIQNNKAEKKPIFLYPKSFYKDIINLADKFVAEGTIKKEDIDLLVFCETKEELLEKLHNVIDNCQSM